MKLGLIIQSFFFLLGASTVWGQTGASKVEIDRIDIKGAKSLPAKLIESAIDISPGDQLERLKVVRTEENLQSIYQLHGFNEVSIQSRLVRKRTPPDIEKNTKEAFETVLEFNIREGRPKRVSFMKFTSAGLSDEPSKDSWRRKESKFRASFNLKVGDILDQEKISEGKRAIQELLASEEYIGAKVTEIHLTAGRCPSDLENGPELDLNTAEWVNVEIKVSLGDRVTFGFRGNEYFTHVYLNSIISDQRLLGLGQDYIGVIESRLKDEYRAAGFAKVKITPFTIEVPNRSERKVTYVINEGPRVKIASIHFDGNTIFSESSLRKQFYEKASGIIQKGIYVEKDIQKASELLIEWMQEKGYLLAKLITINAIEIPHSKKINQTLVKLVIYLYEGDQTLVQNISIVGANALSREEFKKLLQIQEGCPLNLFAFGEGIEAIKRAYYERGYLGIKILNEGTSEVIHYHQENRFADISLNIEEGPQFRVSRIEVDGLVNTHESLVRREFLFEEGKVLSESQMILTERQLRKLGIFSSVTIRPMDDPMQEDSKIVRVILQEADRGVLAWGPGLRNDLGVRLFSQLSYNNLWGWNHSASMTASVNRRFYLYRFVEGQAQLAYAWPWFASIPSLTFRPSLSGGRTQFINFDADTISLGLSWDKPLLSKPNLIGQLAYSLEKISQFNSVDGTNRQELQIGTITPRLSLDLRDNSLVPTSGVFATVWFDLANSLLGSQSGSSPIGYYRAQFRGDYYHPVFKDIIWYFSFRTGFEQNFGAYLPLIKQFALGGVGSLRGYQLQELNYQNLKVAGSLAYVNYRTQVDFPLTGALKLGVFVDAANLLLDRYSFGNLFYGPGFGLHYQTPVGDVNFDIGFRVPRVENADSYQIHFSVGVI